MLYEAIDLEFFPHEIDAILDEAIIICPAMKCHNSEMYPANVRKLFPECTEQFAILGAALLNDLAFNFI